MFDEIKMLASELGIKGRVKDIPFPLSTIKEVEEVGGKYMLPVSRFMYYWLYLSGQRISEALRTRRPDVFVKTGDDGNEYIVVNSITLKNRHIPRRTIPIPLFGEEKSMAEYVWQKIDERKDNLFMLSRTNAWNYLNEVGITVPAISPADRSLKNVELRIFPHYMRHCRATHMVTYYGYDIVKLMQFFGWSSPSMASVYVALNWRTLAESFSKV